MLWIIIAAVAVFVLFLFFVVYNRLVRLRNRADNAWAQVDVQLKRRYDLIPNLVETVRGYAGHERDTFEAVIAARNAAQSASTITDQGEAEGLLGGMLKRLFALAEDYPELQASANFRELQSELSETEDKIAVSRQIYNDTTLSYNNTVQTVPTNLVAAVAGFDPRAYFEIDGGDRQPPRVDF